MKPFVVLILIVIAFAMGAIVHHVWTAPHTAYDLATEADEHPRSLPTAREAVMVLVVACGVMLLIGAVRGGV